jgi:hypothetical protein
VFQSDGGGLDVKNESGHDGRVVRHRRARTKPQTIPPRGVGPTYLHKRSQSTLF